MSDFFRDKTRLQYIASPVAWPRSQFSHKAQSAIVPVCLFNRENICPHNKQGRQHKQQANNKQMLNLWSFFRPWERQLRPDACPSANQPLHPTLSALPADLASGVGDMGGLVKGVMVRGCHAYVHAHMHAACAHSGDLPYPGWSLPQQEKQHPRL